MACAAEALPLQLIHESTGVVQKAQVILSTVNTAVLIDSSLASGQCVQTGSGGIFTVSGLPCGSGSGGGGGSSGASAYGTLRTSSNSIATSLTTSFSQINIFTSTAPYFNTIESTMPAQIIVSTAGGYYLFAAIYSTGSGSENIDFGLRVNGVFTGYGCFDSPSPRCSMGGTVNLSSGDIVSIYAAATVSSTIYVNYAQLSVSLVGGAGATGATGPQGPAGSGGGGSSINVSPHSVLFSTGGTTISGNTGMQYDDSVSTMSLLGGFRSGDPTNIFNSVMDFNPNLNALSINDVGGTNGGRINFKLSGITIGYMTGSSNGFDFFASTFSNGTPIDRWHADTQSDANSFTGKTSMLTQFGGVMVQFNPVLNRSSFTSTVVISSTVMDGSKSVGSSGQVLTSQGAGIAPLWVTPSASGAGSISTVTAGVNIVVANSTGPNVVVNLSSSPTIAGIVTFSSNTLGTFYAELFPSGNGKLPGSNSPFISNSTTELNQAIYFDDTSTQTFSWTSRVHNYDGRPLYIDILFHSTATTNFVCFGAYTSTMTPNVYNVSQDVPVFSVVVTTAIALSGVSLSPKMSTVQLTNTTVSNGDKMTLKLERETGGCGNTEAVGFARVDEVFLRE